MPAKQSARRQARASWTGLRRDRGRRRRRSRRASGRRERRRGMARQTVLSLFPKERSADELPKRPIGGKRDEHPIAEQRETVRNELQPAAPDRRQHEQISEGAVAGEQIEQAEKQQRLRKNRIEV